MTIKNIHHIISYIIIVLVLSFMYNDIGFGQVSVGGGSSTPTKTYTTYTDGYGGNIRDYGGGLVEVYDKWGGKLYDGVGTITKIGGTMTVVNGVGDVVYETLGYTKECNTGLYGICAKGTMTCNYNGCGSCVAAYSPSSEICDNIDNNCNGTTDEGGVCVVDNCPSDPNKTSPGVCGCGVVDYDPDNNNICGDQRICGGNPPANYENKCNLNACGIAGGVIGCDGSCSGLTPSVPSELCNGLDDDCDGQVDEGFNIGQSCTTPDQGTCKGIGNIVCSSDGMSSSCNAISNNPTSETCTNQGQDNNCDGIIDNVPNIGTTCSVGVGGCSNQGQMICSAGGLVCSATSGNPVAEICTDNIDNDCDGVVNNGCSCTPGATNTISCGSNIGVCQQGTQTSTCQANGQRGAYGSCVGSTGPGIEICNGLDDDCDGQVDDSIASQGTCTAGFGVCKTNGQLICSAGSFSCSATPNNTLATIEICNGLDDDCDGQVDEGGVCFECQPNTQESRACGYEQTKGICRPGVQSRVCNINGQWGNFGVCVGSIYPTSETCTNQGQDNNCDGIIDNVPNIGTTCSVGVGGCSNQGQMICSAGGLVCSATSGNPVAEICIDNIDNDCDGVVNNGCSCTPGATNTISCGSNIGVCQQGTQTSTCQANGQRGAYGSCVGSTGPGIEICNGLDDDCDGQVDEGGVCFACQPGEKMTKSCGATSNIGICRIGYQERTCQSNGQRGDYGACVGSVFPTQETCDYQDNDCDGQADEGGVCFACQPGEKSNISCGPISNIGACQIGTQQRVCGSNGKWENIGSCIGSVSPKIEVCNRQDDDCDGQIDEEGVCIIDNCPMDPDKLNPGLCGCGRVDYDPDNNRICGDQRIEIILDPLANKLSQYIPTNIYYPHNEVVSNNKYQSIFTYTPHYSAILPIRYFTYNPILENIITDVSKPKEPILPIPDTKDIEIENIIDMIDFQKELDQLDVSKMLEYDEDEDYVPGELYIEGSDKEVLEQLFLSLDERFHIIEKEQPFKEIGLDIWKVKFEYKRNSVIMAYISKHDQSTLDIYEPVVRYRVATAEYNDSIIPTYIKQSGLPQPVECAEVFTRQKIAIVDNAFDATHEDLEGIVYETIDVADEDDDVSPPAKTPDWYHGTVMASVASAKANNNIGVVGSSLDTSDLVLIKSTSDSANGADITAGPEALAKAIKLQPNIINLSRGSFKDSKTLKKIISKGIESNITIVASAGNFNKSDVFYPAAYERVISVGALDENNKKANFSNYGSWISISAPGTNINAAIFDNKYRAFDGTSEASAFVAGLISYGYAHGFTLEDIVANLTPSDANVGKGYINYTDMCAEQHNVAEPIKPTNIEVSNTNEVFSIQSKDKLPLAYGFGLLGLLFIIGAIYYYKQYKNKE